MITKIFEIITKTDKSVKEVDNLNKSLETTNDEVSALKTSGKALGVLKNGAKGVAGSFKAMGTALKAAGVGLAIAAFGLLKELFESNQKVVDTFNIAFESLSLAFNDFFNFISKNVGAVSGFFKKIFDDPVESIKAFGKAVIENIINRIKATIDTFGHLSKVVAKVLKGDFSGAMDSAKDAGNSFVDSITGVENSVEKATEVISEGVTALTEYTKSTVEQATANVELKKTAELAAVANQGLIEKYDRQAEQQRQIRDDERKSVEDRKKANNELAAILEKQETAMKANAKTQLDLAEANLKKDEENVEALIAKREALNEIAAIEAQIEGFRSEQKTNAAALQKEEQELISSRLESENNLAIERKRFNAEQIKDERKRLLELQRIDAEEAEIGRERLTNEIALYKEGTQAKVDAEIALAEFEEQIYQQKVNRSNELTALEIANTDKIDAKDKASAQAKIDNQNAILDATSSALSSIGQIADAFAGDDEERARKAFNINKGLGIAQAIISTAQGIMNAYTNPVDVASGVAFAKSISIGLAGAAQIATISTTQFQPSGGGGAAPSTSVSGGGTSETQAPSFNVVGQSGFNQIAGALGQQPPAQAFVVAGDVTTAQQLANNTIQQATF